MKTLIINGSPRSNGNTSELVKQFIGFADKDSRIEEISIYDKEIKGCSNCDACQRTILESYCTIADDMSEIYPKFLASEMVIIASPIYMWQFTPCTLAFLNRLHCLCGSADLKYNKMAGKKIAALITLGDEEEIADIAVNGLKEFCEYFLIEYKGDLRIPFADKVKISSGEYDEKIGTATRRLFT